MINVYARGAVEVLYAGVVEVRLVVPSRCARGTVLVRSRYSTLVVQSRCMLMVRSKNGRGTLVVRSSDRGTLNGTVLVRLRYARGALPVRFWFGAVR